VVITVKSPTNRQVFNIVLVI